MERRNFLKTSAAGASATAISSQSLEHAARAAALPGTLVDDFSRADSLFHGSGWESLNPGYWKI
ncbi:MAG: twin-arginine translocation signal domain-containing protein, partial [Verrucomicrobiales bacterium]|nr:twin-arginine translocation signal domain-containing protein [Verrucomicrobiales bacterium]